MTEKENLILAALKFRDAQLWQRLNDSQIFAVKLKSGEIGYCCVMGYGGEHYSLGFYRGDKGFSTYLKTLSMTGVFSQLEQFEMMMTFDCINCDFVPANDPELTKNAKEAIKAVAKDNGMKIRRPNGWPCFVRLKSDVYSLGLTDAEDIADMTLALQAAEAVAERVAKIDDSELLKLGFENEYAEADGGKVIPLLEKEADGKFAWGMTSTPAFVKDVCEKVKYTDNKLIDQLKRKGHAGIFQCCFAHVPSTWGPIDKRNYPRILILLDKARMRPIPIMQNSENETLEEYLDSLAEMLVGFSSVPSAIEVSDDATEALISDFCSKTGIKLKRVRETSEVEEVWMYISSQLG